MRRGVGITLLGFLFGACGDSSSSSPADAGSDAPIGTRPPPNLPPKDNPPDGIDRTGLMGTPAVIADVGAATDGVSWRDADGALYFTVTGTTLKKLVPGGSPTDVAYEDAGAHTPVGTATGGGARLFVTEKGSIATIDFDDAGVPSAVARNTVPSGVVVDVAANVEVDGGMRAFASDITSATGYVYDPPNLTTAFSLDAGKTVGVATRGSASSTNIYWAVTGHPGYGDVVFEYDNSGSQDDVVRLQAPPNAIAVDTAGSIYVAWARGIDVYVSDKLVGMSPGLPLAAIPTCLTFGGADRKTLFVTTAKGTIYAIPTTNAGVSR